MGTNDSVHSDPACELLDVRAVAELLGCSTRHLYRLADAGLMPGPLRLGNLVRWRRRRILAWLEEGCPAEATRKGRGR